MQPIVFKLPDLGEGVVEAEIVAWHVKPGEEVRVDQPLVELMTDKATVTIPSGIDGRVVETRGEVGDVVSVGSELVCFDTSPRSSGHGNGQTNGNGASSKGNGKSKSSGMSVVTPPVAGRTQTVVSQHAPDEPVTVPIVQHVPKSSPTAEVEPIHRAAAHTKAGLPPLASPAVRRRARELEVELAEVAGSGPNGRITHGDIDHFLRTEFATTTSRRAPGLHTTEVHLAGLRRRIAEKMVTSSSEIPHFTYIEEVDITELESLREHLNEQRTDGQPKLTYLPLIMLAVARSLGRFPQLNAHYDDKREVITRYEAVHLGVATQTELGLCVPVVRHAEAMDLWQAAREMRRITDAARNRTISRNELSGSTFTVTSLGSMGGVAATPIINHPEVAILGVNKAIDRPVVHKGQIAVRRMVNLSGSFDHRVVDGADGAIFIQCVKEYLEHPATIFI